MALEATFQKQGSKQLLPKVSSEAFFKIDFLKMSQQENTCFGVYF